MSNYRGPHVSVVQNFETSAPGIAVEALPPVSIATSYDVYEKELLGSSIGIGNEILFWPVEAENPIYDGVLSGNDYDFYPVKVYADTIFGDIESELVSGSTGVTSTIDSRYAVPGTGAVLGASQATIPYYSQGGTATITTTDLSVIKIAAGYVKTAGIVAGQRVYMDGVYVGDVASAPSDNFTIRLSKPSASDYTNANIEIGSELDSAGTGQAVPSKNVPATLFDKTADFIGNRVKPGDVITVETIGGNEIQASVTNVVNRNTLFFATGDTAKTIGTGADYRHNTVSTTSFDATESVVSYSIERLMGYSKYNGSLSITVADGSIDTTNKRKLTFTLDAGKTITVGDAISFSAVTTAFTHRAISVSIVGSIATVILDSDSAETDTDLVVYTWTPIVTTDIKVSFRSVNTASQGKVVRITNPNDIIKNYGDINVYNELAYMLYIQYSLSNHVCYGINVDSTDDIAEQYATALNTLKTLDVYTHALGTTDPSINGSLINQYVDSESEGYNAHERIAVCAWDEDDLVVISRDDATTFTTATNLTVTNINLSSPEVKIGDLVEVTKDANTGYYEVAATPATDTAVDVKYLSGYEFTIGTSGCSVVFSAGSTADIADRISQLGLDNRRVTNIFPGWFKGIYNDEVMMFPPYFISAAVTGLDSGKIASQSFTNMPMSIPGISSYELSTSDRFSKLELDTIAGGGIDVFVQDAPISQVIMSRHDLTSNMDALEYRERSITKQVDVVAKTVREAVAPLVGRFNITDDLLKHIRLVIVSANKSLTGIIVKDITLVSVDRDEDIKDKINIIEKVTVFIAGNYYEIILNVSS